jgi:hypothetical protein
VSRQRIRPNGLRLPGAAALGFWFLAVGLQKVIHLLLRYLLHEAVALLEAPDELLLLSGDLIDVVVGQPAPAFPHFPLRLFPLPLDLIPIHDAPFGFGAAQGASAAFVEFAKNHAENGKTSSKPDKIAQVVWLPALALRISVGEPSRQVQAKGNFFARQFHLACLFL